MAKVCFGLPSNRNLNPATPSRIRRTNTSAIAWWCGRFLTNMDKLLRKFKKVFLGESICKVAPPKWKTVLSGCTQISYPARCMRQHRSISSMCANNIGSRPPSSLKTLVFNAKQAPVAQKTLRGWLYWPISDSRWCKMRPRQKG